MAGELNGSNFVCNCIKHSGNIMMETYSNNILKLSLQKQIGMKLKLPYFTLFNRRLFPHLHKKFHLEHGLKFGAVTIYQTV